MSNYKLPMDYIDVATRIVEFRTQHPEGSLQQVSIDFREVAGGWWVIYTAAAYRTPDDTRPGHGTAWEPVPGKTNFTRDSEVQNAETAAWGRAIVAALAADTKKGIASAEEVRNRQAPQTRENGRTPNPTPEDDPDPDAAAIDAAHFHDLIAGASTATELNGLAADIANASHIQGVLRDGLRTAYSARLTEVGAA